MNNVIKSDDIDFIAVELGALTKHCPMSSDMLFALLCLRGDVTRNDFKEVFKYLNLFYSIPLINFKFIYLTNKKNKNKEI